MKEVEVVVIGGGPVGMTTALYAVRSGLSVILTEPRHAPIDKACGEGVMPGALAALRELGVDPPGVDFTGITYRDGTRCVTADFPGRPGRGVRRTTLQEALREAVDLAGISVVAQAADVVGQDAESVRVRLRDPGARGADGEVGDDAGDLSCAFVVAADGLHSPTRRSLGLEAPARGRRRHGLRQHFRIAPWSDHVEVHWAAHSEAYVTPVGQDVVGVAVLTSGRAPFQEHLSQFPDLVARLAGAEPVSTVMGAGPLAQRVRSRASGRVLLVGDAGGYVDALTGEGLAVGFAQARVAVRAVTQGRPTAYPGWARSVSWRSTALTRGLTVATEPTWGRRATLRAAVALPGVFRGAVGVLART